MRRRTVVATTFALLISLVGAQVTGKEQPMRVLWRTLTASQSKAWKAQITYPRFVGKSGVARMANPEIATKARKSIDDFATMAEDAVKFEPNQTAPYEFSSKGIVSLAYPNVVSGYFEEYSYTGGAHPNTNYTVFNYGLSAWKPQRLSLKDLFRPNVDARRQISPLVIEKLRKLNASGAASLTELTEDQVNRFVLTPAGITFIFPPYDVASYAEGAFFVKIPYSEINHSLDPDGPLQGLIKR